jgi:hypothetical protein
MFSNPTDSSMNSSSKALMSRTVMIKTIVIAGFVAGTLDISTAMIVYHMAPVDMFHHIASGAFGREASFAGGAYTAVCGLLFHYVIAYSWTTLYMLCYPMFRSHASKFYINGIWYGAMVWIVMNRLVLPLTKINMAPFQWNKMMLGMIILIFAIGMPIAFFAEYAAKKSK